MDPETGQSQLWKQLTPPDPAGARVGGGIVLTPDGKSYAYGVTRELSQLYLVEGLK